MVLLGRAGRRAVELVGLVLDGRRDLAQGLAVLASVVGAEVQLPTGLELDAQVGLCSAAVAAVCSAQRRCTRGNGSGHIGLIS